ncbi:MAG: radical SAM protein [Methanobacteriota archaeon]
MVDVVLINPRAEGVGNILGGSIPLGIACLGESVLSSGFSVKCFDLCASLMNLNEVVDEISRENPLVVGISALTASLPKVYVLIKLLRQAGVNRIVVGGAHITCDPESIAHLGVDYGFLGEGDETFKEFVCALAEGKELGSRNGILSVGEKTRKQGERQFVPPEKIPTPARHLFNQYNYEFTTTNISRGCPFSCIYCSMSCTNFRVRLMKDVISELKEIHSSKIRVLDFIDDVFTQDRDYVETLCHQLKREKIEFKWACTTRVDLIDEKLLRLMKSAGLRHISFGVETGSEELRGRIGKKISNDQIERAFKLCRELNIFCRAYGMFGHPGETIKDMEETIRFLKSLKADDFVVRITDIVPETKIYEIALKEGLITEDVWVDYMKGKIPYPTYIPQGVNLKEMVKLLNKMNNNKGK